VLHERDYLTISVIDRPGSNNAETSALNIVSRGRRRKHFKTIYAIPTLLAQIYSFVKPSRSVEFTPVEMASEFPFTIAEHVCADVSNRHEFVSKPFASISFSA